MTKLEKIEKDSKDLIEEILAHVPAKDMQLIELQLGRLHNLGALEVLAKLDHEQPRSN